MAVPHRRRKHAAGPMDEENFPDNPTRRSADKHMAEPDNTPGSSDPVPEQGGPTHEDESG